MLRGRVSDIRANGCAADSIPGSFMRFGAADGGGESSHSLQAFKMFRCRPPYGTGRQKRTNLATRGRRAL
eukprot:scaffold1748_cov123-Isochrysis_galbana.AAC.5